MVSKRLDAPGRVANLLGALALAVTDRVCSDLQSVGFNANEAATLTTVAANPGLRIRDVATILHHSHSATVRLVAALAARNLLHKTAGHDRREAKLSLSADGQAAVEAIHRERRRRLEEIVADLPPEQLAPLRNALEVLLTSLATDDVETFRICRLCDETTCDAQICPVESAYRGVWP